jgi:hypothetical protein
MSRYKIVVFIISVFLFQANMGKSQTHIKPTDSIIKYKNGNDSIRIIFKKNKINKELTYYPDGKKESKTIVIKDKEHIQKGYHQKKYKFISWDNNGRKRDRFRANIKTRGAAHKDVYWTFREEGKIRFTRESTGWTFKY